jgi:hypothetical protein
VVIKIPAGSECSLKDWRQTIGILYLLGYQFAGGERALDKSNVDFYFIEWGRDGCISEHRSVPAIINNYGLPES